jgi:hypothetical protein
MLNACTEFSVESQFFKGNLRTRIERMGGYSLAQQYRIYLYGNQEIHPPLTDLADPLAKEGQVAADYILEQLEESTNDLDYRDSLVVFQRMQNKGYYDICGKTDYMNRLKRNGEKIKNAGWKEVYSKMLSNLCN